VHEVIQVGERLAEGEAHLVPVDGCWRSATGAGSACRFRSGTSGSNPLSSSGESRANRLRHGTQILQCGARTAF
jgi:hypothetical protein